MWSKAPIAIAKPLPGVPRTLRAGTRTSSNVIPRVSEQRWPMLISFRPTVMPGLRGCAAGAVQCTRKVGCVPRSLAHVSRSTMKPVKDLDAASVGPPVRAKTKYQFATLPLVTAEGTRGAVEERSLHAAAQPGGTLTPHLGAVDDPLVALLLSLTGWVVGWMDAGSL